MPNPYFYLKQHAGCRIVKTEFEIFGVIHECFSMSQKFSRIVCTFVCFYKFNSCVLGITYWVRKGLFEGVFARFTCVDEKYFLFTTKYFTFSSFGADQKMKSKQGTPDLVPQYTLTSTGLFGISLVIDLVGTLTLE